MIDQLMKSVFDAMCSYVTLAVSAQICEIPEIWHLLNAPIALTVWKSWKFTVH